VDGNFERVTVLIGITVRGKPVAGAILQPFVQSGPTDRHPHVHYSLANKLSYISSCIAATTAVKLSILWRMNCEKICETATTAVKLSSFSHLKLFAQYTVYFDSWCRRLLHTLRCDVLPTILCAFCFVAIGSAAGGKGRLLWGGLGLGVWDGGADGIAGATRVRNDPCEGRPVVATSRSHPSPVVAEAAAALKPQQILQLGGAGSKASSSIRR
jgi:hypothetical protein